MPLPVEIPISKHFSADTVKDIDSYVKERVRGLINGLRVIREEKVSQWRKVYYGTPREKVKSFPWQNASNLVIQLVGSYVDQLTAKFIMGIVGIDPLWVVNAEGEFDAKEKVEAQRSAAQNWLSWRGLEPTQLNLLPKYEIWGRTIIKYGSGTMKLMPERLVEQVAGHVSASGTVVFQEHVRHDGPVALPLLFEDFLIPASTIELERAPMVCQRAVMKRYQVENLKHDESYDQKAVEKLLTNPARYGPDPQRQKIEQEEGARTDANGKEDAEWDIFECYLPYNHQGKTFHLIYTWSDKHDIALKRVFNWLPDNELPYTTGTLGLDGERTYGLGYCEMLKDYQEELSAIHNRRGDASTLSNTNLLRVAPGLQLDSNFSIFPNALLPGEAGQVEVIPLGRNANETIKDEQMTLQLATDRAGVGPSSSGSGAGTVNKKNQYSAMGNWQVQSEGNTRANMTLTSFRHSHYCVGRKVMLFDSVFGIPDKQLRARGKEAEALKMAMQNYKDGRIVLPIRAATGSVNKEIEKQNLMLLLNNVRAHGQQQLQLLQAAQNPMNPPEVQHYFLSLIQASHLLMARITKEFIAGDVSSYIPEALGVAEKAIGIEQQIQQQKQQAQQQGPQRQMQPPQQGATQHPGLPQPPDWMKQ